jgi:Esterase-like activity of phytase
MALQRKAFFCLLFAAVLAAPAASASVTLIANGTLTGSSAGPDADLSGLTGTLENGAAANLLGGLGSGIAYAGGNTFLATPDRGPNAVSYNPNVDDTVSYINRFQTVTMTLAPSAPGAALPFALTPTLTATTLLSSPTPLVYGSGAGFGLGSGAPPQNTANKFYFSGRSDNFDPNQNSGNPNNARFDPESIRLSNDGRSVFISDEYGPYVYQFDRATGQRIKSFELPANLYVSHLSSMGNTEISGNTSGRVANKGMEGLAITPDGKTLVGIMQAALIQDPTNLLRIVTIDIATGATHEYGYLLTTGTGVSDIVAINDHQFLLDERDGKGLGDGSTAKFKRLFEIDLTGATDITNLSGAAAVAAAVNKSLFLDLVTALNASGIASDQIPAKIEGLAFGEDVLINGVLEHTLFVANDNDFVADVAGPNQFFVFAFDNSDLPGFVQQQFVPEPSSFAALAAGLLGLSFVAFKRESRIPDASAPSPAASPASTRTGSRPRI